VDVSYQVYTSYSRSSIVLEDSPFFHAERVDDGLAVINHYGAEKIVSRW
jgi:hypothetical protein